MSDSASAPAHPARPTGTLVQVQPAPRARSPGAPDEPAQDLESPPRGLDESSSDGVASKAASEAAADAPSPTQSAERTEDLVADEEAPVAVATLTRASPASVVPTDGSTVKLRRPSIPVPAGTSISGDKGIDLDATRGVWGVLLRLFYPRVAYPVGGRLLEAPPDPTVAAHYGVGVTHLSFKPAREDWWAGVAAWFLMPMVVTLVAAYLPVSLDGDPDNMIPMAAAAQFPLCTITVEAYLIVIIDIFHGGVNPLRFFRSWKDVVAWRVVLATVEWLAQWCLFETLGYFPANVVVTLALKLNLGTAMLLLLNKRKWGHRVMEASNFINALGAVVGAVCGYVWAINQVSDSPTQQLLVGYVYELTIWVLKVAIRNNADVGRDLGVVASEIFIDGTVTACLMVSFPVLAWLPYLGLLSGQVMGMFSPIIYGRMKRFRPKTGAVRHQRRMMTLDEWRDSTVMRFGVACTMQVFVALNFIAFVACVRHGPNRRISAVGYWEEDDTRKALTFIAIWAGTFATLLTAARHVFMKHWGAARDPLSAVVRVSVEHPAFLSAELSGVFSSMAGIIFKPYNVVWLFMTKNGFSE